MVFAANNAIPPRKPIKLVAASDRELAPPLFTALTLNFNLPPELKKYLALSALAKVTRAPNALVKVLVVLAFVHAAYADNPLAFVHSYFAGTPTTPPILIYFIMRSAYATIAVLAVFTAVRPL